MGEHKFPTASPEELDIEIGRYLLAHELGSKDIGDDEARAVGQRWFAARLEIWRGEVCTNPIVRSQLMGTTAKTRNELFAAVVDALLKFTDVAGIPVTTLAARLIHYGVEQLCPELAEAGKK